MTARRVRGTTPAIEAEAYPALRAFLAGYLHQDFPIDHKTPRGAARAFQRDADRSERAALAREAARFLAVAAAMPWAGVREALARLGSAWVPRTRADLVRLLTALSKPGAPIT